MVKKYIVNVTTLALVRNIRMISTRYIQEVDSAATNNQEIDSLRHTTISYK